jgi:hypothetical protein
MLRALLVAVVLANLAFFGWTEGWFDGMPGIGAHSDREPERLAQQVHPEAIVILQAGPASAPPVARCLEAGPLTGFDALAAENALRTALPAGAWSDIRGTGPAATVTHTYRVGVVDAATAARLASLKLDAAGRVGFSACARTEPAR